MFQAVEIFGKQLGDDRPGGSAESRKVTLADLFVLTAGFAIALVLPRVVGVGAALFLLAPVPIWFLVAISILRLILWLNFAITCVIFVRRIRYGSMPRPAEWLSILLTLWLFLHMIPTVDHLVNEGYRFTGNLHDFATWRWSIAGVSLLVRIDPPIGLPAGKLDGLELANCLAGLRTEEPVGVKRRIGTAVGGRHTV